MRTQTHELKRGVVRLAINQHEIWPHVAVAVVGPLPAQWMIGEPRWERSIRNEVLQNGL